MKLGVVAAARAVGCSRATINRYLKRGKLTAEVGENGEKLIDSAELVRVFPSVSIPQEQVKTTRHVQPPDTVAPGISDGNMQPPDTVALQYINEGLRRENELLQVQCCMLEKQLAEAQEEKKRLLTLLEDAQQHTRYLTDQRPSRFKTLIRDTVRKFREGTTSNEW